MSVWSVNKSHHEDHSEFALFRELLQKKIIRPSVQFNKRISDTIRPTFFFSYHLPCFVKKVGPKHDWDNCKEWRNRTAQDGTANNYLCMYMCGLVYMYVCVI